MTDLTEQWRKGELPCGWYYIKIVDIVFIDFFEGKVWKNKKDKYVEEVLAPVPTFEEWKKAYECVVSENEQLTTLKKALKDCQEKILLMDYDSIKIEILQKIDEVLNA